MKHSSLTTATLAALAISATAAFAADQNTTSSQATTSDANWLVDAAKLDGTDVYDFHGKKLGDLQKVLVDPKTGRIRYGIVEVDKSWNWNDPSVAVPWGAFAVKRGDGKMPALSLDATKEKLEKAPKFKGDDANRLYQKEASAPIYSYWSIFWIEDPTSTNTGTGTTGTGTSGTGTSGTGTSGTGTSGTGTSGTGTSGTGTSGTGTSGTGTSGTGTSGTGTSGTGTSGTGTSGTGTSGSGTSGSGTGGGTPR